LASFTANASIQQQHMAAQRVSAARRLSLSRAHGALWVL
jgi:hypothetical protein